MKTTKMVRMPKLAAIICFAFAAPLLALASTDEKIYVAVEGESKLAVYDSATRELLKQVDLSAERHGLLQPVAPHNVQVAPDGKTVWVTANRGHAGHESQAADAGHEGMGHEAMEPPRDEVIVLNAEDDTIIRRIPIAAGAHLAHVVVAPDNTFAYVTAQNESAIYKINAGSFQIEQKIQAPLSSQPHGLRIAPDASHAYIALLQAKGLGILDLKTGQMETVPLQGAPVQTAVTPDGKWALASLYDSKQIAVYDTNDRTVRYIELLDSARGPVQLYPTPDSRYVYVADQGHYFDQPDSHWVFKVDLQQSRVVWSIEAGSAPHGIVISQDGRLACVTNLVSNDLTLIDLKTDREVARLPTGDGPNGVSIWNRRTGGTP